MYTLPGGIHAYIKLSSRSLNHHWKPKWSPQAPHPNPPTVKNTLPHPRAHPSAGEKQPIPSSEGDFIHKYSPRVAQNVSYQLSTTATPHLRLCLDPHHLEKREGMDIIISTKRARNLIFALVLDVMMGITLGFKYGHGRICVDGVGIEPHVRESQRFGGKSLSVYYGGSARF